MNITELFITGHDGTRTLFAATLTSDGAKVIRPATNGEGDTVVDEAWEKPAGAFVAVRDLMTEVSSAPGRGDAKWRQAV